MNAGARTLVANQSSDAVDREDDNALAAAAASAPDELVAALGAAPAPAQQAAIGGLGAGLARSEEKDHPFRAALHALAQKQSDLGSFARALEPRLAEAMRVGAAAGAAPALVPAGATVPAQGRGGG